MSSSVPVELIEETSKDLTELPDRFHIKMLEKILASNGGHLELIIIYPWPFLRCFLDTVDSDHQEHQHQLQLLVFLSISTMNSNMFLEVSELNDSI